MTRAYSVLQIKSVNEGSRTVKGIATTPSVDRVGDIIDPLGVTFANPLPFLWQHRHDQPIGTCEFGKPTASGIPFTATVANPNSPGTLKNRCDEAWQSIELGLVRAVSVGFRPIESAYMDGGGVRYLACEVMELSAVTIPANADATMAQIKSADAQARRARGPGHVVRLGTVAASKSKTADVVKLTDGPRRVVRSGAAPVAKAQSTHVVRLTEREQRIGKIMGEALVRAARRRRLGIPNPVVKL